MHISSQRLYNFRPQFPDQVLNPFETFMSPAENVNMAMFFLKFWAWQAKFAPKKHLDSFWALPTNLPLMSISSSLLTRKRRPPPQLSIILQLRSLLWVLRCHSLPVACNEKVQAGNDLTHPQCALANGWKLQPVGAMQPQQGLGHTWSDEVCAGEISSTDLTCAPSLQMAPRKGKTQKQEEQVSLGPQVAEGENVFGVAHIFASFNDTFVHITDLSGKWVHSILSPFPKGTHNRSWHTNSASVPSSSHENWFKFVLRNDVVVNLSSFVDKESCGATPLLVQFSSNNNEAMLGDRLRREISAESTAEIGTSKYCSILGITLWYWTPNFLSSRGTESWGNFQSLWNTGGGEDAKAMKPLHLCQSQKTTHQCRWKSDDLKSWVGIPLAVQPLSVLIWNKIPRYSTHNFLARQRDVGARDGRYEGEGWPWRGVALRRYAGGPGRGGALQAAGHHSAAHQAQGDRRQQVSGQL